MGLRRPQEIGPQRYRHRPTVTEGVLYDGTIDAARVVVEWGRVRTGREPFRIEDSELLMYGRHGPRYVPEGDLAVLDVLKEPYTIQPEVLEKTHIRLGNDPDYSATPLTIARVRELADEAARCPDRERLRSIVAELAALGEALLA